MILIEDVLRAEAAGSARRDERCGGSSRRAGHRPARQRRGPGGRHSRHACNGCSAATAADATTTALKGSRRCARRRDGAVAVDSDRDELPHVRRRHARSQARRTQRRAARCRAQRENLVHASDRLRARARRRAKRRRSPRASGATATLRRALRTASISASRSTPNAKMVRAFSSCRSSRTRRRSTSSRFRSAYEDLIVRARDGKLGADDLTGASFTLTNPGGIGTSASVPRLMVGQGAIIAAGAITYPPGFTHANDAELQETRRREDADADEHVRSPRHPRRAVRRVLTPRRRAARGQGRFLRSGVCRLRIWRPLATGARPAAAPIATSAGAC